jgi:hypothetical protein
MRSVLFCLTLLVPSIASAAEAPKPGAGVAGGGGERLVECSGEVRKWGSDSKGKAESYVFRITDELVTLLHGTADSFQFRFVSEDEKEKKYADNRKGEYVLHLYKGTGRFNLEWVASEKSTEGECKKYVPKDVFD